MSIIMSMKDLRTTAEISDIVHKEQEASRFRIENRKLNMDL